MSSKIALDLLPFILLFLCIFGAKTTKPLSSINSNDYLSLATCKSYRGLFAIVVIFHHLANLTETGVLFRLFSYMGPFAVAFFFFLSGYGLQKSYIIKSEKYKNGFLLKRIPTVLIPYIIITAIYWLMFYFSGHYYSIKDIILNLIIAGNPIAYYSWFIVNILVFYVVFWLLMNFCKNHYLMMILGGFIWFIIHTLFCKTMQYGSYWFISSQLLVIGMFWAVHEQKIISLFKKKYTTVIILSVEFFLLFFYINKTSLPVNNLFRILKISSPFLTNIFFVLSVLVFFLKIKIGNRVLDFLGEISLELYISHGLFIITLRNKYIYIDNELIWSISVLAGTILFSYGLHILFQTILGNYKRTILKQKSIN